MSKGDKYTDLDGHPGVRVRVERLDGVPPLAGQRSVGMWWKRELIVFMKACTRPCVVNIVDAESTLLAALNEIRGEDWTMSGDAEVHMFHGTFVKVHVWCPAGTATKLGIKGYTR